MQLRTDNDNNNGQQRRRRNDYKQRSSFRTSAPPAEPLGQSIMSSHTCVVRSCTSSGCVSSLAAMSYACVYFATCTGLTCCKSAKKSRPDACRYACCRDLLPASPEHTCIRAALYAEQGCSVAALHTLLQHHDWVAPFRHQQKSQGQTASGLLPCAGIAAAHAHVSAFGARTHNSTSSPTSTYTCACTSQACTVAAYNRARRPHNHTHLSAV